MKHVLQVDHIGIQSENPRILFDFFSQTLGLPVVFDYTEYPNYTSGSVSLGNMFLELMRFGTPQPTQQINAHYLILGFLIKPRMMAHCLQELDEKAIPHSRVMPFFPPQATDDNPVRLWDNVYMGNLLGHNMWQKLFIRMSHNMTPKPSVQQSPLLSKLAIQFVSKSFQQGMPVLTEYHQYLETHRQAIDGSLLQTVQGGKMHIEGVHEIVVGVSDDETKVWAKFFDSDTPNGNSTVYMLPYGPCVRFVSAEHSGIKTLVLKVQSLQHVRDTASAEQLALTSLPDRLQLGIPGGLHIEFVG